MKHNRVVTLIALWWSSTKPALRTRSGSLDSHSIFCHNLRRPNSKAIAEMFIPKDITPSSFHNSKVNYKAKPLKSNVRKIFYTL